MKLLLATFGALVCAFVVSAAALASAPVTAASRAGDAGRIRMAIGTITAIGPWLTIQAGGRRMGAIDAMTASADAVTRQDYAYVYGGGHAAAGVASIGMKGPGHNGRRLGYDCSGSVAAVLAGAGLWPAGSPVPDDAGVIAQLLQERLIAKGPGRPPDEVTLYDHPGVHIFMNIDGRFFGTSDGAGGGSAKGGAGWLDDGAPDASDRAYREYHFRPSVLHDSTTYGHSLTFLDTDPSLIAGAEDGDKVHVGYQQTPSGTMRLRSLEYVGAVTITGTVASVAADGGSFAVEGQNGTSRAFSAGALGNILDWLQVGDQVQVLYTSAAGVLTAHSVTVTARPSEPPAAGTAPPPST